MERVGRLYYQEKAKSSLLAAGRQFLILLLTIIMGVLISVSCNAQNSSTKKNDQKTSSEKKRIPYKKNRAKPNHYATAPSSINRTLLLTNILQQQIIKEMVAGNLQESKGNAIELAPLIFTIKENKLTATDVNPILIAIEFGLQGKNILIESYASKNMALHHQIRYHDLEEVKNLMQEMGVPAERLQIVGCHQLENVQNKLHTYIDFKAI